MLRGRFSEPLLKLPKVRVISWLGAVLLKLLSSPLAVLFSVFLQLELGSWSGLGLHKGSRLVFVFCFTEQEKLTGLLFRGLILAPLYMGGGQCSTTMGFRLGRSYRFDPCTIRPLETSCKWARARVRVRVGFKVRSGNQPPLALALDRALALDQAHAVVS